MSSANLIGSQNSTSISFPSYFLLLMSKYAIWLYQTCSYYKQIFLFLCATLTKGPIFYAWLFISFNMKSIFVPNGIIYFNCSTQLIFLFLKKPSTSNVKYISSKLSNLLPLAMVEVIFVFVVSFDFISVDLFAITDRPFNFELSSFFKASQVCSSFIYQQKHELELGSFVSSTNDLSQPNSDKQLTNYIADICGKFPTQICLNLSCTQFLTIFNLSKFNVLQCLFRFRKRLVINSTLLPQIQFCIRNKFGQEASSSRLPPHFQSLISMLFNQAREQAVQSMCELHDTGLPFFIRA